MRFAIGARKIEFMENAIFEGSLRALTEITRKMSTFTAGCYPAARRVLAAHNQSLHLSAWSCLERVGQSVELLPYFTFGAASELYVMCTQVMGKEKQMGCAASSAAKDAGLA